MLLLRQVLLFTINFTINFFSSKKSFLIQGEEVINPKRNIPLSIVITLVVVTILYSGLSAVLSLMVPYYLLNPVTPFPFAFTYVKLNWASNLISIAAILSLLTWFVAIIIEYFFVYAC
jgi:amino acid transporter